MIIYDLIYHSRFLKMQWGFTAATSSHNQQRITKHTSTNYVKFWTMNCFTKSCQSENQPHIHTFFWMTSAADGARASDRRSALCRVLADSSLLGDVGKERGVLRADELARVKDESGWSRAMEISESNETLRDAALLPEISVTSAEIEHPGC